MERATTVLTRAQRELERELERVRAELAAFDAFQSRVRGVSPANQTVAPSGAAGTLRTASSSPRSPADRVVAAYRETLMALSHYEEDYGDTVVESISAELGDTVASALCTRSDFSPLVKHQTLVAAREAGQRRASFRESIRTEADSLASARATLADLEDAVAELEATPAAEIDPDDRYDRREAVARLRRRGDRLAADRQETLRASTIPVRGDEVSPVVHFYRSLPTSYPILSALGTLGGRLNAVEADVARAVASLDG